MSEENNKKNSIDELEAGTSDEVKTGKVEESSKKSEKSEELEESSGIFDFDDEKEEKISIGTDDDLPEDIKKKLEKKKSEKDSKKSKKGVRKRKKKKIRTKVVSGQVHIKATYNNTIVTFTDENGEVISWASAGVAGFKGPKKSTPYAAQIITKIATIKAKEEFGFKEASVFVKGVGMGRESVIRTLNAQGIFINSIKDITPIPHNGCRPKKPRRV